MLNINCICMSLLYCIVPLAALISTHSCPYRSWIASTPSVQKTTIQIYLNSLFNDYLAQHTCSPPTPSHRPPRLLLRHCFASLPSTQVATVQYILLLHTSCRNWLRRASPSSPMWVVSSSQKIVRQWCSSRTWTCLNQTSGVPASCHHSYKRYKVGEKKLFIHDYTMCATMCK